jgi:hypothetical protein
VLSGGARRIARAFLLAQPLEQAHLEHVGGQRSARRSLIRSVPPNVFQPITA